MPWGSSTAVHPGSTTIDVVSSSITAGPTNTLPASAFAPSCASCTIAPAALRHRVALSPEMQIEGRRTDDVLAALLLKVEAPRQ